MAPQQRVLWVSGDRWWQLEFLAHKAAHSEMSRLYPVWGNGLRSTGPSSLKVNTAIIWCHSVWCPPFSPLLFLLLPTMLKNYQNFRSIFTRQSKIPRRRSWTRNLMSNILCLFCGLSCDSFHTQQQHLPQWSSYKCLCCDIKSCRRKLSVVRIVGRNTFLLCTPPLSNETIRWLI